MTKHYEKQKNRHPEKQIYSGNKMEQFAPFYKILIMILIIILFFIPVLMIPNFN